LFHSKVNESSLAKLHIFWVILFEGHTSTGGTQPGNRHSSGANSHFYCQLKECEVPGCYYMFGVVWGTRYLNGRT